MSDKPEMTEAEKAIWQANKERWSDMPKEAGLEKAPVSKILGDMAKAAKPKD